jgi:CRP-like cAMP-binding protein
MLAEAVASHGRRSARAHLAHLLCELNARLSVVGHARDGEFALPVTQEGIADALGLTSVHVNRTLQGLRATRAVVLEAHRVKIRDPEMLADYGDFRPNYLHLDGMRPR